MKYIFKKRFNWFDLFVVLLAPVIYNHIGWWVLSCVLVLTVVSKMLARIFDAY
jgi:hypothetical protein